ncbi:MAG: hypothetical protein Kow00129_09290 [Thermoleophilia bacterium]
MGSASGGLGKPFERRAQTLKRDSGVYLLVLEVGTNADTGDPEPNAEGWALELKVGALGMVRLLPGRYVYVGSARRNLRARARRHLAREKRIRWHIDYLTASDAVRAVGVVTAAGPADECRLSRALAELPGTYAPIPRFGAGDCREGCPAHLWFLGFSAATPPHPEGPASLRPGLSPGPCVP